jgi:hypothetical protein
MRVPRYLSKSLFTRCATPYLSWAFNGRAELRLVHLSEELRVTRTRIFGTAVLKVDEAERKAAMVGAAAWRGGGGRGGGTMLSLTRELSSQSRKSIECANDEREDPSWQD